MASRWSRRDLIRKALLATGAAAGATLSGIVPEVRLVAHASGGAAPGETPFYARKTVQQAEISGHQKADLLAQLSNSDDVGEVLGQLSRSRQIDLSTLQHHAVRSQFEDGTQVIAVSAVLDDQHVMVHYRGSGPGVSGHPSHSFVYRLTGEHSADLVAASANGRKMQRSQEPTNLPANAALASGGCPWCQYPCGSSCCSYDWWGILECCVWCSGFAGCPPCLLACALAWCGACVWFHCRHCPNCCWYWYC